MAIKMPQPQERQRAVLACPCDEILYGGAAGAGKSFCLILDYMNHAVLAEKNGQFSSGIIFRKTFRELDDLVRKTRDVYSPLGWKFSKDKMEWTSPHGSILRLSYLDTMDDAYGHHGFEYDYQGFDELTLWQTDEPYEYLGSRQRSADGVRTRRVSTTNPGGPGHSWVMKRFQIDRYPHGEVPMETVIKLEDGREIKKYRIFIPGRLKDNAYLYTDGQYEAELRQRPEHIQKMLLDGRWDVVEGAFFSEWDPAFHVVKPFSIPKEWQRWMSMDWGTVHPYCCLWFAQAPTGEIYVYRELYGDGSEKFAGKTNVGTRESATEVARKIRMMEDMAGETIRERYVDTQVWQNVGNQYTVGDQFRDGGVVFQSAKKFNKKHSINIVRECMRVTNGQTQLRIFQNCTNLIRTIPLLQVDDADPEVYNPRGETHCGDTLLYGLRRNTDPERLLVADRAYKISMRRAQAYGPYGAQ